MWFDPPCGQVHSLPHCNAITHEARSAIPVLTVGCVAQPVDLLLDASALPDLALAYYSAPAARVRQVQRKAPPWRWATSSPNARASSPNAPNYARSPSRRYVAIWPHRGKPRRPLVKIAPCRNQNDIGRRTTSSTSFWSSTISVRTPLRVFHHWSGSKLE